MKKISFDLITKNQVNSITEINPNSDQINVNNKLNNEQLLSVIILAISGILILGLGVFFILKKQLLKSQNQSNLPQNQGNKTDSIQENISSFNQNYTLHNPQSNLTQNQGNKTNPIQENVSTSNQNSTLHNSQSNLTQNQAKNEIEKNADFWFKKGINLFDHCQYDEAIKAYDQAIKIKPNFPEVWYNKALTFRRLNLVQKAIEAYDQAIKLYPQFYQAWYNQGCILEKLGEDRKAMFCFSQAITFQPTFYQAWNNRGVTLEKLGRLKEAKEAFNQAILINLNYSLAINNLNLINLMILEF